MTPSEMITAMRGVGMTDATLVKTHGIPFVPRGMAPDGTIVHVIGYYPDPWPSSADEPMPGRLALEIFADAGDEDSDPMDTLDGLTPADVITEIARYL